jgi:hypothetical protein
MGVNKFGFMMRMDDEIDLSEETGIWIWAKGCEEEDDIVRNGHEVPSLGFNDPLNRVLRTKGYIDVDTMTSECDSDLSSVDLDSPTERAAYLGKKGFSASALWILEKYLNSGDKALLKKNLSLMAPLYEKMGKLDEAYDCRAALCTIDKNLKGNNKKLAQMSKRMKKNPDLKAAA